MNQCRERYLPKYLYLEKPVVCIGLKFSQNGMIVDWGVTEYSKQGVVEKENGPMKLSTEEPQASTQKNHKDFQLLKPEEVKDITEYVKNYKQKNPGCTVGSEQIIKFLQEMRMTKDKLTFAKTITTDTKMLCEILRGTRDFLKVPSHKGAITLFCNKILKK